jgi:hypothetical protein
MTGIYKQHTGSELIVDNISFNGFIGIDESAIPLEALFNPNPADDLLMLNWPEGDDAYVWIYALDGKLVFEQTKANAAAINVSHLPEGVYLVKMQHKNAVTTERLVVRH